MPPVLNNRVDDCLAGRWLPKVNVKAQFVDNDLVNQAVQSSLSRLVHQSPTHAHLADKRQYLLLAKQALEHSEVNDSLLVSIPQTLHPIASRAEILSESFQIGIACL